MYWMFLDEDSKSDANEIEKNTFEQDLTMIFLKIQYLQVFDGLYSYYFWFKVK